MLIDVVPHVAAVEDVAPNGYAIDRATVRQKKTGRPVKFELTDQTRQAVDDYLKAAHKKPGELLFTGRHKAVVSGSIALFGTYAVDDDKRLVTFTIKASTFPNWDGAVQPRKIVVLNANEFINENPGGSVGGGAVAQNKYVRAK